MKSKIDQAVLNSMSKDLANWRGPFYFNRKDPRLVVPKYNPLLGSTFNFASPYSYITIIGIVLIIVAAKYVL